MRGPALLLLALCGCAGFGPTALERTHGRYNDAVVRVEEEELLRNIVRMRYAESPSRLEITALATQYELSAQAEARPFFSTEATGNLFRAFSRVLPAAMVSGANRPTLSLAPADDGADVRRFLTPIPLDTLTFLVRSGWPISMVARLWLERANGVPNANPLGRPPEERLADDTRFRRIAALLQEASDVEQMAAVTERRPIPLSGPLPREAITAAAVVDAAAKGMEYRPYADGKTWVLTRTEARLVLRVTPAGRNSPLVAEIRSLLNLRPDLDGYEIVLRGADRDPLVQHEPPRAELNLVTRSTAQVFLYLANGVEAPPEHLAAGVAAQADGQVTAGLFRVLACKGHKRPAGASVAVRYRGHWFYIEDADRATKLTFAHVLALSRLDLGRQRLAAPALTLPVGK